MIYFRFLYSREENVYYNIRGNENVIQTFLKKREHDLLYKLSQNKKN